MSTKRFLVLLVCTNLATAGAVVGLMTVYVTAGVLLTALALTVGVAMDREWSVVTKASSHASGVWALILALGLVALSATVQAKEKKFGPEFTALTLLANQGYQYPAVVIAPLHVVAVEEAVRLVTAEGIDAKPFTAKKSDLPRAFTYKRADGVFVQEIFIVRDSQTYALAAKGQGLAMLVLASAILHENAHLGGANEEEARQVEVDFLAKQMLTVNDTVRLLLGEVIADLRRPAIPQVASR